MAIETSVLPQPFGPALPLRTEPRIPTDVPVELTIARAAVPIAAKLVNISATGMGLSLNQHVLPGEIVCVKLDIGSFFGEIRHCTKVGSAYRAGLKLNEFIPSKHEAYGANNRSTAQ
jgi:PilZ domain